MDQHTFDHGLARSWEANADAWTAAVRAQRIASRRAATDQAVVAAVLARAPQRVLDVGCGEGWLARALTAHGVDVVGIDGSAPLVARADELGGGTFRVLSYDQIIAAPANVGIDYDAIVCNFALLGQSITPLLAALRRCLATNGALVIQTVHPFTACGDAPYRDGWRTETFDAFGIAFPAPMPWYFRTVGAWLAEIAAAHWCVVRCDEPLQLDSGRPLSLLLTCQRASDRII